MSQVLRARMVRSPQRTAPDPLDLVPTHLPGQHSELLTLITATGGVDTRAARQWLTDHGLGDPPALTTPLLSLDQRLTAAGNRLAPKDVTDTMSAGTTNSRRGPGSIEGDRLSLGDSLVASFVSESHLERAPIFNRLLLICGLLELIRDHPNRVKTADDVYDALRWRTVVLPPLDLQVPTDRLSRRPGFADLYLVRQDWVRYEPGEIAYIENVLRGEAKTRTHTRADETEVTVFSETEEFGREERDTQTTDRFELSAEATRQAQLALHLEGSVDVQGPAGPTTVQGHVGGSVDFSQATTDSRALSTSHEAVNRAVSVIESRTRESRTMRQLTRVSEVNEHVLDNATSPKGHVTGVYRWVNKVQRLQVFRYPHRFLIELQLPEPGAWWRKFLDAGADRRAAEAPAPFTVNGKADGEPLGVESIYEATYSDIAARYRATGLPTPPPPILTASLMLSFEDAGPNKDDAKKQPIRFHGDSTLTVPPGYRAVSATAEILGWHNGAFANESASVAVAIGNTDVGVSTAKHGSVVGKRTTGLPNLTGTVPVSVMTDSTFGYGINVVVTCHRLDGELRTWQQAVYDIVAEAYAEQKRAYAEVEAARDASGVLPLTGSNPVRGRSIVRDELKKLVAQVLLGEGNVGQAATTPDGQGYPIPDSDAMRFVSPTVTFFEQAFEWENLSYVLYPYYWGDRQSWADVAGIEGADPDFAAFLRSGSARVLVPARPGFEQVVNFFLTTGIIWGGLQTPAPGDPLYLSLDAEIRAQQKAPLDGTTVGEPWEVRLPTDMVWLQPEADLPTNPDVQLA